MACLQDAKVVLMAAGSFLKPTRRGRRYRAVIGRLVDPCQQHTLSVSLMKISYSGTNGRRRSCSPSAVVCKCHDLEKPKDRILPASGTAKRPVLHGLGHWQERRSALGPSHVLIQFEGTCDGAFFFHTMRAAAMGDSSIHTALERYGSLSAAPWRQPPTASRYAGKKKFSTAPRLTRQDAADRLKRPETFRTMNTAG